MADVLACHDREASSLITLTRRFSRREVRHCIGKHGSAVKTCQVARIAVVPVPLCTNNIHVITLFDDTYPELLRHIPDPPLVLYLRGDISVCSRVCVAVVGARRCTVSGRERARLIAQGLVEAGMVVVSGLALGIDAAAHRGATCKSAGCGVSVAVLGGGLDRIHPATNEPLANLMLNDGSVLISEYPPGTRPRKYHFPERNRLISGLSRAVVVVEASVRSGSLITARFALEQGRDVMAVPGHVGNPTSGGCHRLIRQGAALVETAQDVLEVLGEEATAGQAAPPSVSADLQAVYDAVATSAQTLDQIASRVNADVALILANLVKLELDGFVQQISDGYIRRPRR